MLRAKHHRHLCKGSATSVLQKITPGCVSLLQSRDLGTASMDDGPAPSPAPGKALFPSERLGKPSKLCHQELHLLGLTSAHLPLALVHLPLASPAPSAAGEPCSVSSWPWPQACCSSTSVLFAGHREGREQTFEECSASGSTHPAITHHAQIHPITSGTDLLQLPLLLYNLLILSDFVKGEFFPLRPRVQWQWLADSEFHESSPSLKPQVHRI